MQTHWQPVEQKPKKSMKKKWEKGGGKTTQSPELTFENADSLEASQYNGFE